MMRILAAVSAVAMAAAAAFWSVGALALGLGDVEVRSRLNERFSASIPLISATPEDLESLTVKIAEPEEFAAKGIERSDLVNGLNFARSGNGLRVSSAQAVRDPFLTFIVEARWNGGRLLREYTVLLDPPASTPSPAAAPTAIAAPTPLPLPARTPPGRYGPVQPAQTLWSIAKTLPREAGVTMDQMLLALYNANPQAFADGNINHLLSGRILTVPSSAEALSTDAATARDRVLQLRAATSTARAAVTEPAPAVAPTPVPAPAPVPVPVPVPAPVAVEPAPLPATPSPEVAAVTPTPETSPEPIVDATPSATSTPESTTLEVVLPQPETAAPAPVVEAALPATAPAAEEASLPWLLIGGLLLLIVALLAVKMRGGKKPASSRKSGMSMASDDALPGGSDPLLDRPRGRSLLRDEPADDDAPTVVTPRPMAPELPPAADTVTPMTPVAAAAATAAAASRLGLSVDASDPLTEADFHLAYGLYDEAAQMLKNAIAADPERSELKLKLAETYSAAGKAAEYQQFAESIAGQVTPGEWQQISSMGRALLPDLALFSAGAASFDAPPPAAAAAPLGELSVIDFDLDADVKRVDPMPPPSPATVTPMPPPLSLSLPEPLPESPPEIPPMPMPMPGPAVTPSAAPPTPSTRDLLADIDLSSFDLDDETAGAKVDPGRIDFSVADLDLSADLVADAPEPESDVIGGNEIDTKLDLARAYADMGDVEAAQALLDEVVSAGSGQQQQEARALSQRLKG
ncbi:FimV/HubP family polar landmark protein [Nevskia sp.]|uniref:FimV/HubP family polar landmark protein n=1 Tax=Nevskia sp. TaxID=1929292 RepID=UPI0025CFC4AE|nr:FimV/HubP family polar landmark protein [Nevskia sp.]